VRRTVHVGKKRGKGALVYLCGGEKAREKGKLRGKKNKGEEGTIHFARPGRMKRGHAKKGRPTYCLVPQRGVEKEAGGGGKKKKKKKKRSYWKKGEGKRGPFRKEKGKRGGQGRKNGEKKKRKKERASPSRKGKKTGRHLPLSS